MNVMFVDDEEEFLETLLKRMKKRNVEAHGAKSGDEAMELLKNLSKSRMLPDVIVLDVKMPGMSGIQTLREIKHDYPLVEVVMLTGHASLEVAREGMEIGAFDYLMKPVNIDELLYKVQDAYQKKSIHEEKIKHIKEVIGHQDKM